MDVQVTKTRLREVFRCLNWADVRVRGRLGSSSVVPRQHFSAVLHPLESSVSGLCDPYTARVGGIVHFRGSNSFHSTRRAVSPFAMIRGTRGTTEEAVSMRGKKKRPIPEQ